MATLSLFVMTLLLQCPLFLYLLQAVSQSWGCKARALTWQLFLFLLYPLACYLLLSPPPSRYHKVVGVMGGFIFTFGGGLHDLTVGLNQLIWCHDLTSLYNLFIVIQVLCLSQISSLLFHTSLYLHICMQFFNYQFYMIKFSLKFPKI